MKKPTLLYIPLVIMFILTAAAALTLHASRILGGFVKVI